MIVSGFLLKRVLENNTNLTIKLIKEISNYDIIKIEKSKNAFGYNFSRPVVFFDCTDINGGKIFLAIQDVYENIMRKETIFEFLINKSDDVYDSEMLLTLNYFENCSTSKELVDEVKLFDKKIYNINVHNISDQDSFLREFCIFLYENFDSRIIQTKYKEISDAIVEVANEISKQDNEWAIFDLEKAYRDRTSIFSDAKKCESSLNMLAFRMYLKEGFNRQVVLDFFEEFDRKELDENLDFWKKKYELAKHLLDKGVHKDEIINVYGVKEAFIYWVQN